MLPYAARFRARCRALGCILFVFCALGTAAEPALGQLVPLGDPVPFELDELPSSGQVAVAASPSGESVVVWTLEVEVRLQRFDATGAPVGESAVVNEAPFTVSDPSVAYDAEGNLFVSWLVNTFFPGIPPPPALVGRRFDPQGEPLGGEIAFPLSNGTSLVPTPAGGFAAVYLGLDMAGSGVFFRRLDAAGQLLGEPLRVSPLPGTRTFIFPRLAVAPSGELAATWGTAQSGVDSIFDFQVHGRLFDASGEPVTETFSVAESGAGFEIVHATAGFAAFWRDPFPNDFGVGASPASASVAGRFLGAEGPGEDFSVKPEVDGRFFGFFRPLGAAVDPAGRTLVVWEEGLLPNGTGMALFGQQVDSFGGAVGPRAVLRTVLGSNARLTFPAVAALGPGRFLVAWREVAEGTRRVVAQRFGLVRTPFPEGELVDLGPGDGPALAANTLGETAVAWEENGEVFLRRWELGEPAPSGEPLRLNPDGSDGSAPAVAVGATGRAVAVWREPSGSPRFPFTHRGRRIGRDGQPRGESFLIAEGVEGDPPAVAMDAAGRFAALWQKEEGPPDEDPESFSFLLRRFGATGEPAGPAERFSVLPGFGTTGQGEPRLASDPEGRLAALWRSTSCGFVGCLTSTRGRLFESGRNHPEVSVGALGVDSGLTWDFVHGFSAAWTQVPETPLSQPVNGEYLVAGRSFTREGEPGTAFEVKADPEDGEVSFTSGHLRLASDPLGRTLAVWQEGVPNAGPLRLVGQLLGVDRQPLGGRFTITERETDVPYQADLAARGAGRFLVTWAEPGIAGPRLVAQSYSLGPEPCLPTSTTLCLGGGRFAAEAFWRDPRGAEGRGQAVALAADTGGFWFFDAENLELAVKILDGSAVNGRFWVFYGALTNVELTLVVRDAATGAVRLYRNPQGRFASAGDTESFPAGGEGSRAGGGGFRAEAPLPAAGLRAVPAAGGVAGACIPSAGILCLAEGRFQVEVEWADPHGGAGSGEAVPLTADTGAFWFFGPGNVELLVKVLDARALDGHFWVFYGSLTNVAFTLTITDTETGAAKTYTNPQGTFASVGDTRAF